MLVVPKLTPILFPLTTIVPTLFAVPATDSMESTGIADVPPRTIPFPTPTPVTVPTLHDLSALKSYAVPLIVIVLPIVTYKPS